MKNLGKIITILIIITIMVVVYLMYRDSLYSFADNIINPIPKDVEITSFNDYARKQDFEFVQHKTNLLVNNYQELINIYYSILDSGHIDSTFYCSKEYVDCISDTNILANDSNLLSDINNFVHPYNTFSNIKTIIHTDNKVDIRVSKNYTSDEINFINNKMNEIIASQIKDSMSIHDKIKAYHDHIVNTTRYNDNYTDEEDVRGKNAYELFMTGTSYCVGYSDVLSIYINTLGIKNYKIASNKHIWNFLIFEDGKYHIDMTWNDPVTNTGDQLLKHDYFLISTEQLLALDMTDHNFDKEVYKEAK